MSKDELQSLMKALEKTQQKYLSLLPQNDDKQAEREWIMPIWEKYQKTCHSINIIICSHTPRVASTNERVPGGKSRADGHSLREATI